MGKNILVTLSSINLLLKLLLEN